MLNFRPICLEDRAWIEPVMQAAAGHGSEFSFVNLYLWGDQRVASVDGTPVFLSNFSGSLTYPWPVGCRDLPGTLELLRQDARERGIPLRLFGLLPEERDRLEALCPGRFRFHSVRDSADYVYETEQLAQLHGKKLQAKRNHCNRFEAAYPDYRVLPLTADQLPRCRAFTDEWYRLHFLENDPADYALEQRAIGLAFDHFDALGMTGLVLEVEGEVVAFAMGNPIRPDMFDVNFEKARADMNGPYPMINREFARRIAQEQPQYRFLNREDDMGLAGLRRAKESYIPDLLLEKLLAEELPAMRAARRDLPALTRLWQACFGDTEAEVRAFWQALFDLHARLSAPRAGRQPRCHAVRAPGGAGRRRRRRCPCCLSLRRLHGPGPARARPLPPAPAGGGAGPQKAGRPRGRARPGRRRACSGSMHASATGPCSPAGLRRSRRRAATAALRRSRRMAGRACASCSSMIAICPIRRSCCAGQETISRSSGAGLYRIETGDAVCCAAAERDGETLLVRELLPDCPEAAAALADKLGCREASFRTAGGTQPFGMAKSLDGTPLPQRAYLGPAFE